MRVDSLGRLRTAFGRWRAKKRHVRERVPEKLMERAHQAAAVHGVYAVAHAAKIDYCRLAEGLAASKGAGRPVRRDAGTADHKPARGTASRAKRGAMAATRFKERPVTPYSRLEFPVAETTVRPLAEVETPAGMKVRVFAITPETVSLLSALSGPGRVP